MKFKIDHDYHIHSFLSECSSDSEQNKDRILAYAKENGLSSICITDHHWDEDVKGVIDFEWYRGTGYDHISKIKPLPKEDGIEFLFGCEADMDMNFTFGISEGRLGDYDFIVASTTHMHMPDFTIAKEDMGNPEVSARLWVERFEALLSKPLPFYKMGIAHLACGLINCVSREAYLKTLSLISDKDMERLFAEAARTGIGIELNQSDMIFTEAEKDTVLRPFRIAKSLGCRFYLGSDAHHPEKFQYTKEIFERAVALLDLTENDKFHIGKRV